MEPLHSPGTNWPAQSFRNTREELGLFLRTFGAMLASPRTFPLRWARGEVQALNPLAFFLTSVAVLAPFRALVASALHIHADGSLWLSLCKPLLSMLPSLLVALLLHSFLRFGGSEQPVSGTIGLVLYFAGAQGLILATLAWPLNLYAQAYPPPHPLWISMCAIGVFCLELGYWVLLARALHGLHQVRWWWTLVGVALSLSLFAPMMLWLQHHHRGLMLGVAT